MQSTRNLLVIGWNLTLLVTRRIHPGVPCPSYTLSLRQKVEWFSNYLQKLFQVWRKSWWFYDTTVATNPTCFNKTYFWAGRNHSPHAVYGVYRYTGIHLQKRTLVGTIFSPSHFFFLGPRLRDPDRVGWITCGTCRCYNEFRQSDDGSTGLVYLLIHNFPWSLDQLVG